MQNIKISKSPFFSLVLTLASVGSVQAARVVETAEFYPAYRVVKQADFENICWAAAAKSVLKMYDPSNRDSVCQMVSKVRNSDCCLPGDGIKDECNQAGFVQNVYSRYNFSYFEIGVDFEQVYRELKAGRLINMVINVAVSRSDTRMGHVNTIYKAERLKKGAIRFYVGDSSGVNWYSFDSDDVKYRSDGRWTYSSLASSFTLEKFVVVLPKN